MAYVCTFSGFVYFTNPNGICHLSTHVTMDKLLDIEQARTMAVEQLQREFTSMNPTSDKKITPELLAWSVPVWVHADELAKFKAMRYLITRETAAPTPQ